MVARTPGSFHKAGSRKMTHPITPTAGIDTAKDKLDVAVHKKDGAPYDYHRLLYTFRVKSRTKDAGIYRPRHRWSFSETAKLKQTPQS